MTSANETQPRATALTRRDARALAARQKAGPAPARLSRRRAALSVFSGVAALGFVAAYLVPAGAALAEAVAPPSSFEHAAADAQAYVSAEDLAHAGLERGAYEVYVAPKPPPEPEPEPTSPTNGTVAATGAEAAPVLQTPFYTGGGSASDWMAAAGIPESDWGYVDYIVTRESGWNPNATNPSSGACGLVQALPCSKVPGNGYDPVDNLTWGNGYAVGRYGSWAAAYAFWTANHWW
ncbi:transglycosylase SLT domain-containing protein [Microbacterium album]|uniref:aggregation-promoting factor C-terminal-like domain-containing protein n=1 Tax=Microbacterium album TaxID=2053191 RepID=UPI001E5D76E7|nr:transglycosylase SLT domain-containing protein [Microbacterium album]